MINLTSNAIREIKRLQQSQRPSPHYLRIKVNQGGCADLYYHLDLEMVESAGEDLVFSHHEEIPIIVDRESYQHIENLVIDYAEDLMGGAFQYQNPSAQNICSCGISFSPQG